MADFQFRCKSPQGDDLCFNNGSCFRTAINTERCACPEGFSPDLFFFHFDNCVGHSGASITWLPFSILFSIIYVILVIPMVRLMFRLTKKERILGITTITAWTFTELFVISSVIQEGCFESCAVFSSLAFMCDFLTLHFAVVLIMEALQRGTGSASSHHDQLSVVTRRHISWFRAFTFALVLGSFCSGVAMFVFTRDEDRRSYNIATLCNCIFLWLAGMFFCACIVVFSNSLEAKINEAIQVANQMNGSDISPNVGRLKLRLKALRIGGLAVGIPFILLVVPFPITFYYLGSIPYYFIISILHFGCNILVMLGVLGFLSKTSLNTFGSSTVHYGQGYAAKNSADKHVLPHEKDAKVIHLSEGHDGPIAVLVNASSSTNVIPPHDDGDLDDQKDLIKQAAGRVEPNSRNNSESAAVVPIRNLETHQ
jgi:hypothetical protein